MRTGRCLQPFVLSQSKHVQRMPDDRQSVPVRAPFDPVQGDFDKLSPNG